MVRYENGIFISVSEAGEAFEQDGVFQARPAREVPAQTGVSVPHSALADLESMSMWHRHSCLCGPAGSSASSPPPASRRTKSNGSKWTEESRRVHISLVNPPLRALIDLASFDIEIVTHDRRRACARRRGARRAETHPSRAERFRRRSSRRSSASWRWSRRGGGFDGRGQPIETRAVTHDAPPNWYRPGYAVRPVRAWMNIRALPFGSHRSECAARHRAAGAGSRHDAARSLRRWRRCFPDHGRRVAHRCRVARRSRSGIHMQPVRSARR